MVILRLDNSFSMPSTHMDNESIDYRQWVWARREYSVWKLMGVCRWPLKIGPKEIEGKMEFGAKNSISVRIGSFNTPKDRFGVGGWEKVPQKIEFNPQNVNKRGQNGGTSISPNIEGVHSLWVWAFQLGNHRTRGLPGTHGGDTDLDGLLSMFAFSQGLS